jgi:hypothetical protein
MAQKLHRISSSIISNMNAKHQPRHCRRRCSLQSMLCPPSFCRSSCRTPHPSAAPCRTIALQLQPAVAPLHSRQLPCLTKHSPPRSFKRRQARGHNTYRTARLRFTSLLSPQPSFHPVKLSLRQVPFSRLPPAYVMQPWPFLLPSFHSPS